MGFLTNPEIQEILRHMIDDDSKTLKRKFSSRISDYEYDTIDINELESCIADGWEEDVRTKTKIKIKRKKKTGRNFEDDIWCMFYSLGFKILNLDEKLSVRYGKNTTDRKQLDVVAVSDEAIFVVECKASDAIRTTSFKTDIDEIEHYRSGITKALQNVYGEKKVKFVFATRNFRFNDNSDDIKRLKEKKIYHLDENSYNYIVNLTKAYKDSVLYQFYGLMFRTETISPDRIKIPALKGTMGGKEYYMLSIEPSTLLKIGFVLHRTKVNKSMAPTYQRLLVPSRLKGLTKFIDEGGYFPNSIIINFACPSRKQKVIFEPAEKTGDGKSRFGILSIPNAYGIAYIIDGQHRVYGYAGSKFKNSNTIPVVAFVDMESEEQLKIFMDINENQKAVRPSLRLDLAEDINWESERADSRMLALRSAIIKEIATNQKSVLYSKISVGEDTSSLQFKPFDIALQKSGLLPKAYHKQYVADQDVCLYDCNNLDHDKAMNESKKRITELLCSVYSYIHSKLEQNIYETFIECNRGSYAFVALVGTLNRHLINNSVLTQNSLYQEQTESMCPYLDSLVNYLSNMSKEDQDTLLNAKGSVAESTWLHMFQDPIHKDHPDYAPADYLEWNATQDSNLQDDAKNCGMKIESYLHDVILNKQKELLGESKWEKNMLEIKSDCLKRMNNLVSEDEILEEEWTDYLTLSDIKKVIEKNWIMEKEDDPNYIPYSKQFTIFTVEKSNSKRECLKWLTNLITYQKSWSSAKGKPLTKSQVNEIKEIYNRLLPNEA